MKKYGHIIASLRKKAGLTQDQLGQKLNVTYQAVSKWENNLSEPDLETIDKITQIFGITVAQFFDMEQNPNLNIKEQKNIPKQQVTGLDFISKKPWWLIAGLGILIFILSLCVFFIPKQQSSDNIFKNISPSTFSINTYKEYDHLYRSTGFFINNSGLAVTTFDIIDGATRGNINLDGKTYSIESVVGVDKEQDIALIQIDITHSKPVVIGSAGTELAQKVYTVGYNQNCQAILNESLISKISHENNHKYWQLLTTSCQDGSALVNQYGQVVGMITSSFYGDAGMNTAVPLIELNNIKRNINLSLQEYYENKKNFNFYSNGLVIAKQEFLSGHKVKPIDNPIRTGYSFAGWYTNETFETEFDFDSPVTTQNACYAKWTPNTYSIKFNANGGTGQMADITATYDVDLDLPTCTFEVENYNFVGWSQTGNNNVLMDGQTIKNLSSTNGEIVELTALWEKIKYTIVFDSNTADSGTMENLTLEYDQTTNLPLNKFSKTGYLFNGWAYNGQVYDDQQEIVMLSETQSSIILIAQWKPITYTVDFRTDPNQSQGVTQTFVYDEPAKLNKCTLPAPKGDYITWFEYWLRIGTLERYEDEQEVINLETTNNESVVLVAVWQPAYFIINFAYNGGTCELDSVKAEYDSSVCIETLFLLENVKKPTRTGYSFAYWECEGEKYYHHSSYTFPFEQSDTIIEKEFKAIWAPNSYTARFYASYDDMVSLSSGIQFYEQDFIYGQSQKLKAIEFEKTGMIFDYWQHVKSTTYIAGRVEHEYGEKYYDQQEVTNLEIKGITKLYAVWKSISFNVEFHNIDNQGGVRTANYTYSNSFNKITPSFELARHTLLGFNYNGVFYEKGKEISFINDFNIKQGETYKIYAVWEEEQTCEIQFYSNGGEGEMQTIQVYPSEPYYFPECLFSKEEYKFLYWTINGEWSVDNHNRYIPGAYLSYLTGLINKNKVIVLWANWEKV